MSSPREIPICSFPCPCAVLAPVSDPIDAIEDVGQPVSVDRIDRDIRECQRSGYLMRKGFLHCPYVVSYHAYSLLLPLISSHSSPISGIVNRYIIAYIRVPSSIQVGAITSSMTRRPGSFGAVGFAKAAMRSGVRGVCELIRLIVEMRAAQYAERPEDVIDVARSYKVKINRIRGQIRLLSDPPESLKSNQRDDR